MFQREILIITSLATIIFVSVAATGWFAVRELHETSRKLVMNTLPGMVDTGLAEERMNDNRRIMREMLSPHSAAERAQMIGMVRTNSTGLLWKNYADSISEEVDRQNYEALLLTRSNYISGSEQFFGLVTSGKTNEAAEMFDGELGQKFQSYDNAAKRLFTYNVREGVSRGKSILKAARFAPWLIGGLCVLVFFFGMVLGVRSALGGGK